MISPNSFGPRCDEYDENNIIPASKEYIEPNHSHLVSQLFTENPSSMNIVSPEIGSSSIVQKKQEELMSPRSSKFRKAPCNLKLFIKNSKIY